LPDLTFQRDQVRIPENSHLYLFSDGVYEVINPQRELWGLNNLIALLSKSADGGLDQVIHEAQSFQGRTDFEDDFSLLRVSFG